MPALRGDMPGPLSTATDRAKPAYILPPQPSALHSSSFFAGTCNGNPAFFHPSKPPSIDTTLV